MKVIIVGAGLGGLAAGTWLRKFGHEVILLEAEDRIGGRALTIKREGTDDILDVGTQYFHTNYKRAKALIRECGLDDELQKVQGKTRFFDDRLSSGSFSTGHRYPYIRSGSLFANLVMIVKGALTMLRYRISPYALQSQLDLDELPASERIADPFQWEYNVRTLVVAGTLAEPAFSPPSFLHVIRLMRIIVMTNYLTLRSGIASLHEALANRLEISLSTPVTGLLTHGHEQAVQGVILKDGRTLEADHVIMAVPASAAADIFPDDWTDEQAFLTGVSHPPATVVSLYLDGPLEQGIWSYVFRPSPDRLISFCIDCSQKNPAMTPSGKATLQAWICHPASDGLKTQTEADIVQAVVDELSSNFPDLRNRLEGSHVIRHIQAVPQFPSGHNQKALHFLSVIDKRAGLDVCGDYLSGGYMECALWSAERAVRRITQDMPAL